jgi:mRNA-degrading endonuclease toxin of MazEF toxin-antitoxin module
MKTPRLTCSIALLTVLSIPLDAARAVDPRPLTAVAGGGATATAADSGDPAADAPAGAAALEFVRVNAAAAAVPDLPLDQGRYVPMPLAEFDAAVAAIGSGSGGGRRPTALAAEYDLAGDGQGSLVGRLVFELGSTAGALRTVVPLGAVATSLCSFRTAAGTGEAAVFGLSDGRVAVHAVGPGSYACEIRVPGGSAGRLMRIPLVPALVTTLRLELPTGLRPIVLGPAANSVIVEPPQTATDRWLILVAAGSDLRLALWDTRRSPPPVTCWNRVAIRGRQADVAVRILPTAGWTPTDVELRIESGLVITSLKTDDGREVDWTCVDETLLIRMPDRLAGSLVGLVARGIAPIAEGGRQQEVPGLRPPVTRWAGSGTELVADPAFAVDSITLEQCLAIAAVDAADWPLPPVNQVDASPVGAGLPAGCRLFLEHQAPNAVARIAVRPRSPALDTARVTTIDLSPGTILGRAACDVRVVAGEVFALNATVAPGWFIDSVEAIDWKRSRPPQREETSDVAPGLDWRVVRAPEGNELRIGLAVAATPARSLGLRISGHRPGVPLGGRFTAAELDMVRLPGESPESALLEFRVGPMAVVEAETGTLSVEPATGRLAPLAAEVAPRARVRAGTRAPDLVARLVRRRPPVEAEVRVGLVARDERLAETFSFTCRPVAGELDAIVVHFSEPIGSGLEWSLSEPATGSLAARRLDPGEASAGAAMPEDGVAESWLVDVRPATAATVRINASRTIPLEAAVPVPLAWIEAAEQPGGVVTIAGEGGQRPELVNRRLREVPPLIVAGTSHPGTLSAASTGGTAEGFTVRPSPHPVAADVLPGSRTAMAEPAAVELAYGSPESVAGGGQPAAEILPAESASGSRAWAWRESTTCRCHDAGMLEWESVLDIENQGRGAVNITVPEGLLLEQVSVAGVPIAASEFGRSGGTFLVPLPSERGRMSLVIRGTGRRDGRFGWWSIGGIACGVDLPILTRDARLLLPPGLDLATGRSPGGGPWTSRLFNARLARNETGHAGRNAARSFDITTSTRGGVTTAVVVRRQLIASLAILAGGLCCGLAWRLVRRHGVAAALGCGVAGIAALWSAPPWDMIAMAAWWGSMAGSWAAVWLSARPAATGWGSLGRSTGVASMLVGSMLVPGWSGGGRAAAATDDPEPLRVIISPAAEGGMALVPEQLFRRLAAAETGVGSPSLRVLATEVVVGGVRDRWQVWLDVDADRGGSLRLAGPWGKSGWLWTDADQVGDGLVAGVMEGGGVRLFSQQGGRSRVELGFQPQFIRDGAIETAEIPLPPAAVARLDFDPGSETEPCWQCDLADAGGHWLPAAGSGTGFDVSRATRVRIVRPVNPADRLVAQPRMAESSNDVAWRSRECRVDAMITVGGEREIVRQLVLQADSGLVPVSGSAEMIPLGDGRYLVELPEPRSGQRTVTAVFQMALADPVGLFEVPGVWLADAGGDVRTVRLRLESGLDAAPELPLGTTLVRPRAEDGAAATAIWRSEATVATTDRPRSSEEGGPRPRIAVRRRPLPVRGSQSLAVAVSEDRIDLRLDVELEAATLPLVEVPIDLPEAVTIDRLAITRRNEPGDAEAAVEIDAVWSRPHEGQLVAVVQRPDTGLFHLRLDARILGQPPKAGRLPLARAVSGGGLPLAVRWRASRGLRLSVPDHVKPLGAEDLEDWLQIPPGEPGPAYMLAREQDAEAGAPAEAAADRAPPAVAVDVGVALTMVNLAIDHRGRGWGLVRFDLVSAEPVLLLELPAGLRLFDVRVDGREVTAMPRANSTWEVRLHDVTWPRTLVAVFAGTLSGPLADGKPIRLEPPRLVGLPMASVVWSLAMPPGFLVRVSDPARPIDQATLGIEQERSLDWYREAFQAAGVAAEPRERAWLEDFSAARRQGRSPPGEQAWYDAWTRAEGDATSPTLFDAPADGVITVRPVPVSDTTAAGRGLATLAIAGLAIAVWTGGRRISTSGWQAVARWWWLGCGLVWLALLAPAVPGWIMLAFGAWVALSRR